MKNINTLLEADEIKTLIEQNADVIYEAQEIVNEFPTLLAEVVLNNPQEFIGENLEETYKNIRVFSEIATSQFIHEVSELFSEGILVEEELSEDQKSTLSEYL